MTNLELWDVIWGWFNLVLNPDAEATQIEIIPNNDDGVVPASSFLEVSFPGWVRIGNAHKSMATDQAGEFLQNIRWDEDITIEINGYYSGCHGYLQSIRNSVNLDAIETYFSENKISLRGGFDSIVELTDIVENSSRERWMTSVVIGIAEMVSDDSGYIDDVEIEDNYQR